ncbi:MAG: nitroreductase family protein [Clostridiales bacterium]|jgi:nitroreductase|nr:nitroreductase family protein [Clostridiales bacterium]
MEFIELARKRQSVRHYKQGDVPTEDIELMIDAARLAPSGKNLQYWHFIVVKDDGLRRKIAQAISAENERISSLMDVKDKTKADRFRKFAKHFTLFFVDAPALVIVMSKQYEPSGYNEMQLADLDPSWLINEKNPGMQSLGAALEHFTLRAVDLGYGSCWITSANYADKAVQALLKETVDFDQQGYFMAALLSVGIPEDNPKSPPKKNLRDIMTIIE